MTTFAPATDLDTPFGAADEARWRALAEKALKGAPLEKLTTKTQEGLAIAPLLREADGPSAEDQAGAPGSAPFVRGRLAERPAAAPWLIRQVFRHPDPAAANEEILADLQGGVSSVELAIDPEGLRGVAVRSARDFETALAGVHADLAPIALDAGAHGLWAAELLKARLRGVAPDGTAFNIDPLGALMRDGAGASGALNDAARFAAQTHAALPLARFLRVDARPAHDAGAGEALEIACALSTGIAYLRALMQAGLPAGAANGALLFTLAIGPDALLEAAKLRALRLCWARILEAAGADAAARGAAIQGVTSVRMLTRNDAWTNLLRGTASCFAAALGGADAITVLPLTQALGHETAFARRMARNTHLVLMEESQIGRVVDPLGGAWFAEKMTRDFAEAAWGKMQAIEAAGGMIAALESGLIQGDIALQRSARQKAFATRRENITGVSDFPLLAERMPEIAPIALPGILARLGPIEAPAAKADQRIEPLKPVRWAEPFEAARARGEAVQAKAFSANLGPLSEFSARANFAANLLGVGGAPLIGGEVAYPTIDAMVQAFRDAATPCAVLCGADARYATEAAEAAQKLKAAGCRRLLFAGKPADEAGLRAAGVDQFIFAGQDALDTLRALHDALEALG